MLAAVLFPVNARTLQPTEINDDLCVAPHNEPGLAAIGGDARPNARLPAGQNGAPSEAAAHRFH